MAAVTPVFADQSGGQAGYGNARALAITSSAVYESKITLQPNSLYFMSLMFKTAAAAGADIIMSIVEESGGSALQDDKGNDISLTQDLDAVSNVWTNMNFFFCSPSNVPASTYIKIEVTATASPYLADFILKQVSPIYPGGPIIVARQGQVPFEVGDTMNVTITNNYNSQLLTEFDKVFNLRSQGKRLPPTSGTPTQADTRIPSPS